jgi:hypothetical protein
MTFDLFTSFYTPPSFVSLTFLYGSLTCATRTVPKRPCTPTQQTNDFPSSRFSFAHLYGAFV